MDQLLKKVSTTSTKRVEIKLSGRISNTPDDDKRTREYVPLVREKLGDAIIIYAEGNGWFSPRKE